MLRTKNLRFLYRTNLIKNRWQTFKTNDMNFKKLFFILSIFTIISCESEKFKTADGTEMEVSSLIGMDVFDIAYEYSKVSPETLTGTNNQRWVVYYSDINVTLETNKSTNTVQKARKGNSPKSSTYAD